MQRNQGFSYYPSKVLTRLFFLTKINIKVMPTAVLTNSAFCCLHTQVALDNLAATPQGRFENAGMWDALKSDQNMRGYEQITNSVENSRRQPTNGQAPPTVEVKIRKPSCETVQTTKANLCDAGVATSDPYDYLEPEVTRVRRLSGTMTKDEFRNLCDSPNDRIAIKLQDFANDIIQSMDEDLISLAYAQMGDYANGTASTGAGVVALPLISDTGTLNPAAYAKISKEFREQKFRGRPIMVGGHRIATVDDVAILGGTGDSLNLDPNARRSVINSYYDYHLDNVVNPLQGSTGESYGLSWTEGSLQALEWYQNTGIFEEFKEDYSETTIVINGVKFDYSIQYDKCTKMYTFHLQKCYDLFHLPDSIFACNTGNGRVMWNLGCGAWDCSLA